MLRANTTGFAICVHRCVLSVASESSCSSMKSVFSRGSWFRLPETLGPGRWNCVYFHLDATISQAKASMDFPGL